MPTEHTTGSVRVRDLMGILPASTNIPTVLTEMETAWSVIGDCQREIAEFMAVRMEKDSEVFREAFTCKTLNEALALQSRWVEDTMQDYSNETTKMLTIYTTHGAVAGRTAQRAA
jgi:hypothetical protein